MNKGLFKVTGLSLPKSVTCEPFDDEGNFFWPPVDIDQNTFDKLWNSVDGNWDKLNISADIEYESLSSDGIPMNCKVVEIIIKNKDDD